MDDKQRPLSAEQCGLILDEVFFSLHMRFH